MRKRVARAVRRLGLRASAALGIPDRLRPRDGSSVAALLFHAFFDPGEPRARGIERLRRQLDWLRESHTPISLRQLAAGLEGGALPDRAVLVTADDALLDVLEVADEFRAFDVPLSVFVCAGWTASASLGAGEDLIAHAAAAIQWYEGPDIEVQLSGGGAISLSPANKASNIERLITRSDELRPDLADLCARIENFDESPSRCCSWDALRDLARAGVGIGAHSVTHVPLSRTSAVRGRFEIAESKRLCEQMLGSCDAFAYPFGMAESHSEANRAELQRAGFTIAFLTGSEFITQSSDALTLPRIAMPDESMSLPEFRARASGAGIAAQRLRTLLRTDEEVRVAAPTETPAHDATTATSTPRPAPRAARASDDVVARAP